MSGADPLPPLLVPDPRPSAAAPPRVAPPEDRLRAMVEDGYDFVWRTLVRFGVARSEAEDAAQQVFIVASRRLDAITPGAERAFLFQTARRLAWNARRTVRRRREEPEPAGDRIDPGAGPDVALERARLRAMMDRVVEELDLDLREVFVLYELEEMTMVEIARLLEIPAGTVASRLRRARVAFREAVRRQTADGGEP